MSEPKKTCPTKKRRYRSKVSADKTLAHIWRNPRPGRRLESRAYPCIVCQGWHLTSKG
ncbi:hypothetical protein ACWEOE_31795 [Amycolatopsis sp. NPDC004368]